MGSNETMSRAGDNWVGCSAAARERPHVSHRSMRVMLCIVRAALVLVLSLVAACRPTAPPVSDAATDADHDRDGDVDEDAGIHPDAHVPGAGALRLALRVRVAGRVVEEPGEVEVTLGRLRRFDLGVERVAFEGDRPGDPELLDAGRLSPLAGERAATVAPAAPGLYSGVELSLNRGAWGRALDIEVSRPVEPYRVQVDEPLDLEIRCMGGSIDLGVGEHLEVPLYVEADELDEELAELPLADLPAALMDKFVLACDEAQLY